MTLRDDGTGDAITAVYTVEEWLEARRKEPGAQSAFKALAIAQMKALENMEVGSGEDQTDTHPAA